MEFETFTSSIDYLASSGVVLSVETKTCIRSSLVTLQKEHKFRHVKLWGIVKGIQKDYYIVHGVGKNELTERKALYRLVKDKLTNSPIIDLLGVFFFLQITTLCQDCNKC